MDNVCNRPIFDLVNKNKKSRKGPLKISKIPKFGWKML